MHLHASLVDTASRDAQTVCSPRDAASIGSMIEKVEVGGHGHAVCGGVVREIVVDAPSIHTKPCPEKVVAATFIKLPHLHKVILKLFCLAANVGGHGLRKASVGCLHGKVEIRECWKDV